MNSKERHFSIETNFERTTDEFRKNVIRSNDLARFQMLAIVTITTMGHICVIGLMLVGQMVLALTSMILISNNKSSNWTSFT